MMELIRKESEERLQNCCMKHKWVSLVYYKTQLVFVMGFIVITECMNQ